MLAFSSDPCGANDNSGVCNEDATSAITAGVRWFFVLGIAAIAVAMYVRPELRARPKFLWGLWLVLIVVGLFGMALFTKLV